MNSAGIRVRIQEDEKCIYEYESSQHNKNDLNTLLDGVRDVRSCVNNFLTTLIQQRDKTSQSVSSDSESDTLEEDEDEEAKERKKIEEEVEVVEKEEREGEKNERARRKKCKLSE